MTFSCQERNQRAKKQDIFISLINNGIMVFVMIIIDVMINERCMWEDCPIMRCEMLYVTYLFALNCSNALINGLVLVILLILCQF